MEEEFGAVVIDGKIYKLDGLSMNELEQLDRALEISEKSYRQKINKILKN